jgi:hypothetical protein
MVTIDAVQVKMNKSADFMCQLVGEGALRNLERYVWGESTKVTSVRRFARLSFASYYCSFFNTLFKGSSIQQKNRMMFLAYFN